MRKATLSTLMLFVLAFAACGGGGGSTSTGTGTSSGSGSTTPPPPISITNDSQLPDTLQGVPYSATLTAINGQAPLKWTIAQVSGSVMPTGITIDPATGVVSIPTVQSGGKFLATVTDANSKAAFKTFSINSYGKLVAGSPVNASANEYGFTLSSLNVQGGRPPITYSVSSGSLPPGVRVTSFGQVSGSPTARGTFSAVITTRDSWSTPQSVDQAVTITVSAANLVLRDNSRALLVNQPATIALYPVGGVPPYTFQKISGVMPAGMNFDASTGKISGTPTTSSRQVATFQVTDSMGVSASDFLTFFVGTGLGRNDTPQTATAMVGATVAGTLSPYIDPPDKAPLAADTDFYKMISLAGSPVKIYIGAGGGPIDPVVEVVDANGVRLLTCNTPDSSSTSYSSPCINDDGVDSSHNASVDYKAAGSNGEVVESYIHVLDWSGNARPDMQYSVNLTGNIQPTMVNLGGTRGVSFTYTINEFQGIGPYTWSIDNGTQPDGLILSNSGVLSGIPTTDGKFTFRVKVSDSSNPVQTYYFSVTMTIGEPVQITTPATWPNACINQPYTFVMQSSGGVPNLYWSGGLAFGYIDPSGFFSGFPTFAATYHGIMTVTDFAGSTASQTVTVTVQNCP